MGSAQIQGELWGRHPDIWSTTMEQRMRPLYAGAMTALAPLEGRHLLDAGCGAGQALREAADRGAVVTGLDASGPLLEIARGRVPDAQLHVGDIEELPFGDASYDVVTAFNAIQYAVDPAAAVAELGRVSRALVAIGIWGDPRRCETEGLFARLRSLVPPAPGTPAPLSCSDPGVVEELLTKAGMDVIGGAEVEIAIAFTSLDDAWEAHRSAGPLQKVIDAVGEQPVRSVIDAVLTADRKPDGQFRQNNVMRYVMATKA